MEEIKVHYLEAKSALKQIEEGDLSNNTFSILTDIFIYLFNALKLYLISHRDSYYGYFLMNLTPEITYNEKIVAGIRLDVYPPVMRANPLLFCKFRLSEMVFIFAHEIEHIVLNHPSEMMRVNPFNDSVIHLMLNYACDASVNDRLISDYRIKNIARPFEGIVTSDTIREIVNDKNVRSNENFMYYFKLLEKQDNIPENTQYDNALDGIKNKEQDEYGNNGNNRKNSENNAESSEKTPNSSVKDINSIEKVDDHDYGQEEVGDFFIRENTKALLKQVKETIEKNRGTIPGVFDETIEKLNSKPQISWVKILKKYIGTIPSGKKPTRYRLNRRQPFRYDLKGYTSDKVINLVIAIDTSGSMGKQELSKCFNEIFALLGKRKYILTVIECDAEIQKVYKARNKADIQLDVSGRGGTSFTPVIKYLNDRKEFRDALLVYFTDGFGEDEIPQPLLYKILWVITGKHNELSVKNPYGQVIYLE